MKTLNISFDDDEFDKMEKFKARIERVKKQGLTWKRLIIEGVKKYERNWQ